jgi:hypothetical protein
MSAGTDFYSKIHSAMNFKQLFAGSIIIAMIATACKKGNNDSSGNNSGGGNNGGGGNTGSLTITGVPANYTFWGKELTVTGTGFSTNAADNIVSIRGYGVSTSDTVMTAEVISATATKLVIKVPYKVITGGGDTLFRGFDYGKVRVKVNDKMVTADSNSRFIGIPVINNICHHYGPQQYAQAVQPGDSVVLSCGIPGIYGNDKYFESLSLYINGTKIPAAKKIVNVICGGLIFYLPPQDYCELNNCTVPSPAGVNVPTRPARKMNFQLKIEGTGIVGARKEFYVINQPNLQIVGSIGGNYYKSAGGNPYGTVTGKYFQFKNIKWVTTGLPDETTAPPGHDLNTTSMQVFVPLGSLQANGAFARTYTVYGITHCEDAIKIGQINIYP